MEAAPRPVQLFERDVELRQLAAVADACAAGEGAVAAVVGPAGIGKTALLKAVAASAAPRCEVLSARGGDIESSIPLGAVRELLAPAVAALDDATCAELADGPAHVVMRVVAGEAAFPTPDAALAVAHGVAWLLGRLAERAPLLLLVDDAHLLDPASRDVLVYLARRLDGQPLGLVVASQPTAEGAPLDAVREAVAVSPRPLGAGAVRRLVRETLGPAVPDEVCDACGVASGGNPHLLVELLAGAQERGLDGEEVVQGLAASAPEGLRRETAARLDRLGEEARAAAQALAVLERAELPVVAALVGGDEEQAADALGRLERAGLVEAAAGVFSFAQPLLRTAVLATVDAARRDRLDAQAAEALAAGGRADRAAAHLLACAPRGRGWAVDLLCSEAERALAAGAPRSAVAMLERARAEAPDPRAGLLAALGRARLGLGDPAGLEALGAALQATEDPIERARIVAAMASAELSVGEMSGGLARLRAALDETEAGSAEEGVLLSGYLGSTHAGFIAHARARFGARAEVLRARGEPVDAPTLANLAVLEFMAGEPAERVAEATREVLTRPDATSWVGAGPPPYAMAAWALAGTDRFAEAEDALEALVADARRAGSHLLLELAITTRVYSRWRRGDLAGTEADAERVLELSAMGWEHPVVPVRWALSDVLLDRGRPEAAAEVLAPVAPLLDEGPPAIERGWALLADARLARETGDARRALRRALAAGEIAKPLGVRNPAALPWASAAAEAAAALGEGDRAVALADDELARAEAFGAPRSVASARRVRAVVGPADERAERLRAARDVLAGSDAHLERARVLCELGSDERRRHRLPDARETLREALDIAHRLGADALARRVEQELRAAAGRPRRARSTGPAGLTPREHELCVLAAAGRTNREIAEGLFLTTKTVETHLRSAYRKLGVRSRAELPEALGAQ